MRIKASARLTGLSLKHFLIDFIRFSTLLCLYPVLRLLSFSSLQGTGGLWISYGELPESTHAEPEPHPVSPAPRNDAVSPWFSAGGHRELQGAGIQILLFQFSRVSLTFSFFFPTAVSPVGALQRGVSVHEGLESRCHGSVLRGHQSSDQSHAERPSAGTKGQLRIPQSEIPSRWVGLRFFTHKQKQWLACNNITSEG